MKTAYDYIREQFPNVKPSMSYDGKDFPKWQKAAKEKLTELLGLDKMKSADPELEIEFVKEIEGATEIRFTFQSEPGYRIPCHLWLPNGIEKPPVMICLQGHTNGMHISMGRRVYKTDIFDNREMDFSLQLIKQGFAALAMELRNFGECGGDEAGTHCFEEALTTLLMGRTLIGERVWDIMRLIDVVKSNFADKVDIDTICCMGLSGGGTATAYVAALEPRLTLAMPICAVCSWEESIAARRHCACNYVPRIAEYFDMGDIAAMAYPTHYVQVNGEVDSGFYFKGALDTSAQVKRAYTDMGHSERYSFVAGSGGHRFYADLSYPVVHKHLENKGE
jgi:cephalosporin-C deacetylase-like acetyl esterase